MRVRFGERRERLLAGGSPQDFSSRILHATEPKINSLGLLANRLVADQSRSLGLSGHRDVWRLPRSCWILRRHGHWTHYWRHPTAIAHSPWFQLWQRYGLCCRMESPTLGSAESISIAEFRNFPWRGVSARLARSAIQSEVQRNPPGFLLKLREMGAISRFMRRSRTRENDMLDRTPILRRFSPNGT